MKGRERFAALIGFLILGVLPTVFLFKYHDALCLGGVSMNPWCFLLCSSPVILSLPFLLFAFGNGLRP